MAVLEGSDFLLLSWLVWIAGAVVFHVSIPWQSRMPALLTDILTYGKLRPSSPPSSFSSTLSRVIAPFTGVPRRFIAS